MICCSTLNDRCFQCFTGRVFPPLMASCYWIIDPLCNGYWIIDPLCIGDDFSLTFLNRQLERCLVCRADDSATLVATSPLHCWCISIPTGSFDSTYRLEFAWLGPPIAICNFARKVIRLPLVFH